MCVGRACCIQRLAGEGGPRLKTVKANRLCLHVGYLMYRAASHPINYVGLQKEPSFRHGLIPYAIYTVETF